MSRVHVSLQVADLDASIRFYQTVFGRGPDKRRPDYANFRLDEPALMLALVAGAGGSDAKRHYGVELTSASVLEGWQQRLRDAGMTPRPERDVTCCYAVADKFWVSDPDGNDWEFWVFKSDADSMYEPVRTACCG